jgi:hypothetical protein
MYIGDGKNPAAIEDFNLMGRENIVRLVNFLAWKRATAQPPFGPSSIFPSTAVARVSRFFEAHQQSMPATHDNCRWASLSGLTTHITMAGPNCSVADLTAAIAILPTPGDPAVWEHLGVGSINYGD